jgi:hypothetical protein
LFGSLTPQAQSLGKPKTADKNIIRPNLPESLK